MQVKRPTMIISWMNPAFLHCALWYCSTFCNIAVTIMYHQLSKCAKCPQILHEVIQVRGSFSQSLWQYMQAGAFSLFLNSVKNKHQHRHNCANTYNILYIDIHQQSQYKLFLVNMILWLKPSKKKFVKIVTLPYKGQGIRGKNLQNAATFKTQFCAEELNKDNFTNR